MRAQVTFGTAQVLVTVQSVAFTLGACRRFLGPEIVVQKEYVFDDIFRA